MDNVVYVDFELERYAGRNPMLMKFAIMLLERGIDRDDVLDVLDAVGDINSYSSADGDVKKFADIWLQHTVGL